MKLVRIRNYGCVFDGWIFSEAVFSSQILRRPVAAVALLSLAGERVVK
ncbi:MAG: hypothetical protein HQM08_19870 [Candidatus Riflebacteria bacterium]|nr:hypothetical protein [Candidatus Riflebacteria bacterium]